MASVADAFANWFKLRGGEVGREALSKAFAAGVTYAISWMKKGQPPTLASLLTKRKDASDSLFALQHFKDCDARFDKHGEPRKECCEDCSLFAYCHALWEQAKEGD